MKKYIAEAFGTAVLVFVGCASVVIGGYGGAMPLGVFPIAAAFGLAVTAMAYTIGSASGCHINPAVTVAFWLSGRLDVKEVPGYIIAQVLGAFIGAGTLMFILQGKVGGYDAATSGLGQTMFTNFNVTSAFLIEAVATFIFTTVILGVTCSKCGNSSMAGIVIGFTLLILHLAFVSATGASLNPARSIAPAVYVGGEAMNQLWVYIVAPLVGGAAAGIARKFGCFKA